MQLFEIDQTNYYIVDVDSLSSWFFFLSTCEDWMKIRFKFKDAEDPMTTYRR